MILQFSDNKFFKIWNCYLPNETKNIEKNFLAHSTFLVPRRNKLIQFGRKGLLQNTKKSFLAFLARGSLHYVFEKFG